MKTIKEIADICDVSKTTVQRSIKALNVQGALYKNRLVFDDDVAERIIAYTVPGVETKPIETEQNETAEVHQTATTQQEPEQTATKNDDVAPGDTQTAPDRAINDILIQQLKSKDQQIERLLNQIETLTETNRMQSQNIAFLTKSLEDKQAQEPVQEHEPEPAQEPEQEKKNWFMRLFGL